MDPDAEASQQPLIKKRRSTFDFFREKELAKQAAQSTQASQPISKPAGDDAAAVAPEASTALVPISSEEPPTNTLSNVLFQQDSISEELSISANAAHEAECVEEAARLDATARHRSKQLEARWRSTLQRRDSQPSDEPRLPSSANHITADFSLKNGLRFATSHGSFKWLRPLPHALRRGPDTALKGAGRDAVLSVCKQHLPTLMENPDMAMAWMEKLSACLVWFEVEGPLLVSKELEQAPSAVPEERSAKRRVEEWDEAFRSLQVLLRQGLISSYVIASERFTVTVFGEGSGPWDSAQNGDAQKPSQECPCAVLCPSQAEIRAMLQESHVAFDIAEIDIPTRSVTRQVSDQSGVDVPTDAIVPIDEATRSLTRQATNASAAENQADMRALRRSGERVITPDEMSKVKPPSTALWFGGSWRVHGMLDVLRQFLLSAPLPSAPSISIAPLRLPRLIAPTSFSHAAVHSAEVVKTQTLRMGPATASASSTSREKSATGDVEHTAELSGCFFPSQVRRLLELLRVPLPSFTCRLAADPRHSTGINAFTQLGMYRLSGVRCEKLHSPPADGSDRQWNWDFELAKT